MEKIGLGSAAPRFWKVTSLAASLVLTISTEAAATENGNAAFPPGGEEFNAALMPPPGWYGELMFNRYGATRLNGDSGNALPVNFDLTVNAVTTKLAWVKPASMLGSDRWGTILILPALDIDLSLAPAPGVKLSDSKRGLADLTLGNGLHWTLPSLELINAIDLQFKNGSYDKSRLVNIGQNRTVVRLVNMATWTANPDIDISYRLNWDFHQRNNDTNYRSGQVLNLNYAIGWKPAPGLTIGPAGYFYRQLSDDNVGGRDIGNRLRINSIGAVVKQFFPGGKFISAKFYHESGNRNAAQGNVFWLSGGMAL